MKFRVRSPERIVFEQDDVGLVVLPGEAGDLGVMPDHTPVLTPLRIGVVRVRGADDAAEEALLTVGGGFAEITPERVDILADSAERVEEIDSDRAQRARERAQERLARAEREAGEIDIDRARLALLRALNRLEALEKTHRR